MRNTTSFYVHCAISLGILPFHLLKSSNTHFQYFLLLEASSTVSKSISYFSLSFLLTNSFEPWEYITHYINTKSLCFEIGMHCFLELGKLICPH